MEIKRAAVEKFLGPIAEDQMQIKVSLFVVSSKNHRLKKLSLENLTHEERAAKLHKWGQQDRFVAVIEMGDMVFANVHAKHAEQLQRSEDLTLNGKRVIVKALTDEEAAQLSAVGEAIESYALQKSEEEKSSISIGTLLPRQDLSTDRLISGQMQTHHLIGQIIKNHLDTIIINCLRKYNEAQREMQKRKEADDKYFDIKRNEIKKDILREEIKQGDIKDQEQKQRIIKKGI
jgi:exosome complex RNA-binding protein Csl4